MERTGPSFKERGGEMITITGVRKKYRSGRKKIEALKGVSLTVKKGEVFGLVGPNGAGKTTLIKCLLGLTEFEKGKIQIGELDHKETRAKTITGYLPEEARVYTNLTGRENLLLFASLLKMDANKSRKRTAELLEFVGLKEAGDSLVRTYSKGMMQRISLAQALLNDPEIVILDEPMSGLDPLGRIMMIDLIKKMKQEGKTILMSTHIIPDVEAVCDRFALIHKGKVIFEGGVAEVIKRHAEHYVVKFLKEDSGLEEVNVKAEEMWELFEEGRAEGWKVISVLPGRGGLQELFKNIIEEHEQ